jgi:hypothetical protein
MRRASRLISPSFQGTTPILGEGVDRDKFYGKIWFPSKKYKPVEFIKVVFKTTMNTQSIWGEAKRFVEVWEDGRFFLTATYWPRNSVLWSNKDNPSPCSPLPRCIDRADR